jgi:hypothetical protein
VVSFEATSILQVEEIYPQSSLVVFIVQQVLQTLSSIGKESKNLAVSLFFFIVVIVTSIQQ